MKKNLTRSSTLSIYFSSINKLYYGINVYSYLNCLINHGIFNLYIQTIFNKEWWINFSIIEFILLSSSSYKNLFSIWNYLMNRLTLNSFLILIDKFSDKNIGISLHFKLLFISHAIISTLCFMCDTISYSYKYMQI